MNWKTVEKKVAKKNKAYRQPASGAFKDSNRKSDIRKPRRYRVEVKSTTKDRIRVTSTMLDKISAECDYDETPLLLLDVSGHRFILRPTEDVQIVRKARKSTELKVSELYRLEGKGIEFEECARGKTWEVMIGDDLEGAI